MTLIFEYCDGASDQSVITEPESGTSFPSFFDFKTIFMEFYIYIFKAANISKIKTHNFELLK